MTIRTGQRGRPRKEYQMIPPNIIEEEVEEYNKIVDLAEISLKEAINSPDRDEWKAFMCDEVKSLLRNNICRFTLRKKPVADGSQIKKKHVLLLKACRNVKKSTITRRSHQSLR